MFQRLLGSTWVALLVFGVAACSDPAIQLCEEEAACAGETVDCEQEVRELRESEEGKKCKSEINKFSKCAVRHGECVDDEFDIAEGQCISEAFQFFGCAFSD